MKILLAQQNVHIGDFEKNTEKIIQAIASAKEQHADLVVFSELAICGYPSRDFFEFDDYVNRSYASLEKIKAHADTIGVLVGAPARNTNEKGKSLYNSAFFLYGKEIKAEIHKTLIPTYDVFDEGRYFEPASAWNVVPFKGKRLAVTICEDIWNLRNNPLYTICPMDEMMSQQPDVMINLSASPFDYAHATVRKSNIKENVLKYGIPMLYCNTVGSQTEIVFDGGSVVMDTKGNIVKEFPYFQEVLDGVEIQEDGTINNTVQVDADQVTIQLGIPSKLEPELNTHYIYDALVMGIRDYFTKMDFKQAIIGSSGGIDSAVTIALASAALGAENVRCILMPSPYSTEHSIGDAVELSKNLGNPYDIVPIKNIYESFLSGLDTIFGDRPFSVAEENIQSRTRGNLLMAIANKLNYILLNTSNKSELSTGYGTLYGDMAGGLGVLGDCYKQQVYALARYINMEKEIIPNHILAKAPSAELRPGQKDSDSLPDYAVLDQLLYQYVERRQGPNEIKAMGFDAALVDKTLRMVNMNEYKRNQFCPVIRVSPKAFGVGRRIPIVGKYLS